MNSRTTTSCPFAAIYTPGEMNEEIFDNCFDKFARWEIENKMAQTMFECANDTIKFHGL